jgi:3,5-epimerase/4-reductase
MKILIYGSKGWIGGMIVDLWQRVHPEDIIIRSETRVIPENHDLLATEISECDRIICCIGRTSGTLSNGTLVNTIDYCETNLLENIRDNLTGPLLLAKLCDSARKHMLYIGTGCIFSWDTNTNTQRRVTEQEYPDFFGSAYSIVKGQTDSLIRNYSTVCNVRIRMPVSNTSHQRNFITKIVGYSKIHNTNNSVTYLPNMLDVIVQLSRRGATGIFNCTNPGYTCHTEILDMYRDRVNPDHKYTLVSDPIELGLLSKRSNNLLNTTKLEKWCAEHNIQLLTTKEALEHCFNNYTASG